MIPVWQIHRNALIWLLAAFTGAIVLHAGHLPPWVLLAASLAILWQVQRYRGVWASPRRSLKYGLLALCVVGLLWEYGKPVGLEPMVTLLVSAYLLKLLEMEHRRDALLMVFLTFFLVAIVALFDQSIGNTVYILACLLLALAALIGLHQSDICGGGWGILQTLRPMKSAALLLLQSVPLMLLLFIIMPRVGAFWSVPLQSHSAKTGMSDRMSPGDVSRLGRSADVAFRVSFSGDTPRQHQLYWRGLVLSEFDGRSWSQTDYWGFNQNNVVQWRGQKKQSWDSLIERKGQPIHYSVILEATQQPWLYALSTPVPKTPSVGLTRDFRLLSRQAITAKTQYDVISWLDYRLAASETLPVDIRAINVKLPQGYNPRSVELAQQWRRSTRDDMALVQKILALYNQDFIYSLSPSLLGKHSVDDFLFETKKGFCEHFSSSFVFLMRAAGIPARVVAGYQGGERHPDGYLVVRQYDAHAWAEVWIEGKGWIRVDPTAAVAPERIEFDLETALPEGEGFLASSPMSLVQFRHINWLNTIRLRLDALNFQWAKWVLGYDNVQQHLLEKWFGHYSPLKIALVLLVVGGGFLALIALWQLRSFFRHSHDDLDSVFLLFCRKLEKSGFERQVGEGPRDYATRVAESRPDLARQVSAISSTYEYLRYGKSNKQRLKILKRAVRKFK